MVRLWLTIAVIFFTATLYSQTKITGTVKSSLNQKPIYDARLQLSGTEKTVQTDRIGYFQILDVMPGKYKLSINLEGYQEFSQTIEVKEEKILELGEFFLIYDPKSMDIGVITLTSDELASDESSAQSAVGLLQSSKDVFAQTAAYELGAYWFRTRGYDNKYNDVYFNGVRMNKIGNGRVNYGNWGGLNDITRYPAEVTYGIEPSDYSFGDLGGVNYIDTRPSNLRAGTSFSYSLTNRSYRQRLMLTHNTGLSKKGWGFVASASRRWAEEGRVEGTFYDAWAYFLGIEKKLNDRHSLNLSIMGAPYRRSSNSPNTQEAYDLMGTGYNAYWGYQAGKKRNERVKKNHEPLATLSHYWKINNQSRLITTLGYQTGKNASSRLDWSGASNPSPIYFKNLPSYQKLSEDSAQIANEWLNGNIGQINWDNLVLHNLKTYDGIANYYLLSDVNEDDVMSFSTNYRNQLSDNFTLRAAVNYQGTKSENYRELNDLLGGKYVLDVDDFKDPGQSGFSDEANPNFKAKKGDKIQYHYNLFHDNINAFVSGNYRYEDWNITVGAKLATTSIQREGIFDHYRYKNSKGKSEKFDFLDYGAKLQLQYKLDGRNYIVLNGGYFTNAPTVQDVFPQGRTNNLTIPNLESAKYLSGDLNYVLRSPRFKARATAFYTKAKDEVETAFGYLQLSKENYDYNLFTAQVLSGVDKEFLGSEVALEAQLTTRLTLNAVASIGQYIYANNPDLYYFSDAKADVGGYEYQGTAYMKNYKLSSTPQKGYSLGFQYRDPNYWWFGATGNYLADNYVSLAASRRTQAFLKDAVTNLPYVDASEERIRNVLRQEKFDNAFMLNVNAGKTFKIGDYYMGLSLTVNNVLNNKNYKTGGFEQLRLANYRTATDKQLKSNFGNRYWYDQGLSYFFNLFIRF